MNISIQNLLKILISSAAAMALCDNASAEPFQNMGFDSPREGGFRIPGWTTAPSGVGGSQSQSFIGTAGLLDVNYRDTHFGLNAPAPVVGNYALGVWPSLGGRPFTLSQTGDIPADAQSLQFLHPLAPLRVFIGGVEEPLHYLGDRPTDNPAAPTAPYFAVDVSPFAGKTAEIKFEFRSYGYDDFSGGPRIPFDLANAQSHVLDDLKFSALPASVPEPGTYAMFALGFAVVGWHLHRQRS